MNSSKPYLIRAIYEWISDNEMTQSIIVDTENLKVSVPKKHIKNDKIILNISASATHNLRIGNDALECDAKFNGVNFHIYAPIAAILAIYAQESNQGMTFPPEEIIPKTKKINLSKKTKSIKIPESAKDKIIPFPSKKKD